MMVNNIIKLEFQGPMSHSILALRSACSFSSHMAALHSWKKTDSKGGGGHSYKQTTSIKRRDVHMMKQSN